MKPEIKVSVCVVTYNQELFIKECLESLLCQKTSFNFEIIVCDDCSTDRTREIISAIADRYPGVVKPIFNKENLGALSNFIYSHTLAAGEYIAHMDGDDFALPGKLQAQNDILDLNQDVALVAHPMKIAGSEALLGSRSKYPEIGNVYDLLNYGAYFCNSSTMYRAQYRTKLDHSINIIDYYRFIEIAQYGNIFLLDKVFGVYRVHGDGISKNKNYIELIQNCYSHAFEKAINIGVSEDVVRFAKNKRKLKLAISFLISGQYELFRSYITVGTEEQHVGIIHKALDAFKGNTFILRLIVLLSKFKSKLC